LQLLCYDDVNIVLGIVTIDIIIVKAQIPLRRLCDKVQWLSWFASV